MSLIDLLNGIKKSTETFDVKQLISAGVLDQFLSVTKHIFPSDLFVDNLFSTYSSYLKSDKTNIHEPVIIKAKTFLNEKDFARFMVGTFKLLAVEQFEDFLLKSDGVKDTIEESSKEGQLSISMSSEIYEKYKKLLGDKILGI